jgi:O-antigen/teichoic acid export membrane protein
MAGRPGWHTAYVLAIVAVNFAGNYLLIPVWGLEGAATALATSVVASAVVLRVLARRFGVRI